MRKRSYWIEPLFGEAKDFHRLRRFRLRGLLKFNIEGVTVAAGQNLKRLIKHRLEKLCPFMEIGFPTFSLKNHYFCYSLVAYGTVSNVKVVKHRGMLNYRQESRLDSIMIMDNVIVSPLRKA